MLTLISSQWEQNPVNPGPLLRSTTKSRLCCFPASLQWPAEAANVRSHAWIFFPTPHLASLARASCSLGSRSTWTALYASLPNRPTVRLTYQMSASFFYPTVLASHISCSSTCIDSSARCARTHSHTNTMQALHLCVTTPTSVGAGAFLDVIPAGNS